MRILTVLGARPQFVKAAVVSRALARYRKIRESILHTGQHFDPGMSDLFFRELSIPPPVTNLHVHGGTRDAQVARMMKGIEREAVRLDPDLVLVHGDTNSTLAGALAASKLGIPLAHVEAGLRSFNAAMPEESNRILTDRMAAHLFAPTPAAVRNLRNEGIAGLVHRVGDVMVDAIALFRKRLRRIPARRVRELIPKGPFFVLTLHRQENTDDGKRLKSIFQGLAASPIPFLFPVHPRTRKAIRKWNLTLPPTVRPIEPVGYLEMILLQEHARAVWTDSGGMQKESVILGKHCYTLRDETEWVETVTEGWNQILGADPERIRKALRVAGNEPEHARFPTRRHYGDGRASEKIARILSGSV